jgi:hypothetical protein
MFYSRAVTVSVLLCWLACGPAGAEDTGMKSNMLEVQVPVREHRANLPNALEAQVAQLTSEGFRQVDRYYNFAWTTLVPEKSYLARFEKLMNTPDGTSVLYMFTRGTETEVSMAFVLLQFGEAQPAIKEALAKLSVGQFIEIRVDF